MGPCLPCHQALTHQHQHSTSLPANYHALIQNTLFFFALSILSFDNSIWRLVRDSLNGLDDI
jgi:hypothetical protein